MIPEDIVTNYFHYLESGNYQTRIKFDKLKS